MSFVLMEDLKPPLPKRRFAFIGSVRVFRPFLKLARFTYRGSRFLVRQAKQVVLGDRSAKQAPQEDTSVREVQRARS